MDAGVLERAVPALRCVHDVDRGDDQQGDAGPQRQGDERLRHAVPVEVDVVPERPYRGAVGQPRGELAIAVRQQRNRHRRAVDGVAHDQQAAAGDGRPGQSEQRVQGGNREDEGRRDEGRGRHQRPRRTGQRAEPHVENEHAEGRREHRVAGCGGNPDPEPGTAPEQVEADAADDAGDQQADLVDERRLAGAVTDRQRRHVDGTDIAALSLGDRGEGGGDRLLGGQPSSAGRDDLDGTDDGRTRAPSTVVSRTSWRACASLATCRTEKPPGRALSRPARTAAVVVGGAATATRRSCGRGEWIAYP